MFWKEDILEQRGRVRNAFAEVYFLVMRGERYGIGECKECGDADLLRVQEEVLSWQEQKEADNLISDYGSN